MTTRHIASRRRKTKYERMSERKTLLDHHQQGKGLYRFRNRNNAPLGLPKPGFNVITGESITTVGVVDPKVPGSGEWDGDDYFMQMLKTREAILVKVIRQPDETPVPETAPLNEAKEEEMTDEKLILDQPDQVTEKGTVEHVVPQKDSQPLNEVPQPPEKGVDTLLTEDPMSGLEIIND